MSPGHTSVVCGRGGTAYLDCVCEDADVGGSWSAFGLCNSGGLGVGSCVVLCPSCCDGAGGEGAFGAFCVGGRCWRCDAASASLAKWKRTSCASYWRRWIDREDASPFPTPFLCLFWWCAWGWSRVGTRCCLRVIRKKKLHCRTGSYSSRKTQAAGRHNTHVQTGAFQGSCSQHQGLRGKQKAVYVQLSAAVCSQRGVPIITTGCFKSRENGNPGMPIFTGCVYFHDTGRLRDDLADIGKQLRCLTDATEQIDAVC